MATKKGYVGTYWITKREEGCLRKMARHAEGKKFLEIGTFNGIIITSLAKSFPKIQFDTVDPFKTAYGTEAGNKDIFLENIRLSGVQNIRLFEMESNDAVNVTESDYGAIFVDGDHSYEACLSDLKNYIPKLLHGGYCLIHDYGRISDVRMAVKSFLLENCDMVSVVNRIDGSILIKKARPEISNSIKLYILSLKEMPVGFARGIYNFIQKKRRSRGPG